MRTSHTPIKVAIADDYPLFCAALKKSFTAYHRIKVLCEVNDGKKLLGFLKTTTVDVVLIDIEMPFLSGSATLREVRQRYPSVKVIMMMNKEDDYLLASYMMNEGANACIAKTSPESDFCEAVQDVFSKKTFLNDLTSRVLLDSVRTYKPAPQPGGLNEREVLVVKMMWNEKSTKEIAQVLGLSSRAVDSLRQDARRKIRANTNAGMFQYALRKGIISL